MRLAPGLFCLLLVGVPVIVVAEPPLAATDARAIAGDEIALPGGRILHLQGIAKPFEDKTGRQAAAQQELQNLVSGRQLIFDHETADRYGRLDSQVYAVDEKGNKIWLQGEVLKRGLAFLYPPTGNETRLDEMRVIEANARRAGIGIWSDPAYADIPADRTYAKKGGFAFVSGPVVDTARVKNKVYLNFGPDWRKDFTVTIVARDLHKFRAVNIDPLALKGKSVRVRGWVKREFGPMITVTAPEQIEVLTQP